MSRPFAEIDAGRAGRISANYRLLYLALIGMTTVLVLVVPDRIVAAFIAGGGCALCATVAYLTAEWDRRASVTAPGVGRTTKEDE